MKERNRAPDVLALAEAFAQIIENVQERTGKYWREDAFTGEAIRHGIDFLIRHFAASGVPVIPSSVEKAAEEAAARGLPVNERDRSPAGIGASATGKVITLIEFFWGWNTDPLQRLVMSDEMYRYWQLLRDLGSGAERAQTYIQMERRR